MADQGARAGSSRGEKVWIGVWLFVGLALLGSIYVPLIAWMVTRGW